MSTRVVRESEKQKIKERRKQEVAEIRDSYVIRQLLRHKKFTKEQITPEIIEWSRSRIKATRENRQPKTAS